MLLALTVNAAPEGAAAGLKLRANVSFVPFSLDVSVAVCADVTADTVAVNPAVVALAATVTDVGTLTAALLLARPTAMPPLGATAAKVTVQASVPLPVTEVLAQESPLSAGAPQLRCHSAEPWWTGCSASCS